METISYFAVLPLSRTDDGDFLAEAAIEMRSAEQAKSTASKMAGTERGARPEIRSLASGKML
jgi:hypothetical protein